MNEATEHTGFGEMSDYAGQVAWDLGLEGASLVLVFYVIAWCIKGCGLASWLRP